MNILIGVVIGGVLLALLEARHQTITATIGTAGPGEIPPVVYPPNVAYPQMMVGSTAVDSAAIGIGVQGLEMGLDSIKSISSAVPIIGSVVGAIAGAFLAGHVQRQKEAISENAAVDNFITKGFDPGVAQVVNAYNRGQLSANEAIGLLDTLWKHYWAEVTPAIQPGRNGCNGGAGINYSPGHPPSGGDYRQYCSGSWGAACCVGRQVIGLGLGQLQQAIATVDRNGGSKTVEIPKVYPSKYSKFSRPGFNVTVQRPR